MPHPCRILFLQARSWLDIIIIQENHTVKGHVLLCKNLFGVAPVIDKRPPRKNKPWGGFLGWFPCLQGC